jgi:hypothetical protein
MRQATLFDEQETKAAPIARASDPVTSQRAAARIEKVVTAQHALVLAVLKRRGHPMTAKELAKACCEEYCSHLVADPEAYADKLSNYRKRSDEIKRNPDLCIRLEEERDGGQLFRAKEQA